jgi:hypothetical protein
MKTSLALAAAAVPLLIPLVSSAQTGQMMNGGMWDGGWMVGYGGLWTPILLVIAVAAFVAWIVKRSGK